MLRINLVALGAAHDWQPLEPDGSDVFLARKSRRIHPAAKREAHEYRTVRGIYLIRAGDGRRTPRHVPADRNRLGSLERAIARASGA